MTISSCRKNIKKNFTKFFHRIFKRKDLRKIINTVDPQSKCYQWSEDLINV